jgi:hypothetical protein
LTRQIQVRLRFRTNVHADRAQWQPIILVPIAA